MNGRANGGTNHGTVALWPRLLRPGAERDLPAYRADGGYRALRTAGPALIDEIDRAGLRGRGGAAFPTATKWRAVVGGGLRGRHVVVNVEEGEPASGKDRWLLRHRPHLVLDGALLAAAAVAAGDVWIYTSDQAAAGAARAAVAQVRTHAAALADRLPRLQVATVPHTYVAGEETAVVRALSGGPALPTTKPPRPFESGVGGGPTLVHNAETLAHVALIARYGAAWFASAGTPTSPGTLLVNLAGDVGVPALVEVAFGTTVRQALVRVGGVRPRGAPGGFVFGGYFGGLVGPRALDLPLDPDVLRAADIGLGCGAVTVLGPGRCPVAVAAALLDFYARQSAGQCGVCVRGTRALRDAGRRLSDEPDGTEPDLLRRYAGAVRGRGACLLPDGAATVALSLLREFPDTVTAHLAGNCRLRRHDVADLVPDLATAPSSREATAP